MSTKLKVVIIDDEMLARELIRNYLSNFSNLEIAAECENGFEGIKSINEFKPNLIFLDVPVSTSTILSLMYEDYIKMVTSPIPNHQGV